MACIPSGDEHENEKRLSQNWLMDYNNVLWRIECWKQTKRSRKKTAKMRIHHKLEWTLAAKEWKALTPYSHINKQFFKLLFRSNLATNIDLAISLPFARFSSCSLRAACVRLCDLIPLDYWIKSRVYCLVDVKSPKTLFCIYVTFRLECLYPPLLRLPLKHPNPSL